ncbi:hypothetical protein BX666DRAFT_2027879 [Dichotomocladium elegans]|nr:hypothetical protein BX666DRAFT_2027879 [Dichotomocladium elegans]
MQPMPYYQSGYPANAASYSNSGSPVPSSVLTTSTSSMMHTGANGMSPLPHQALPETTHQPPSHAQQHQPPKRKQVKNACTNCQKACKKCDDARPCPRCIKYGIADTCVNSVRKERKKGIKRGPYKRRQKDGSERSTGRNDESSSLMDPQAQSSGNPYTAMRPPPSMAFGYPTNLNQYGQPAAYDPYSQYAAYHKDQMMNPQSYVVNPVYSSMGYPVLMPGGGSDNAAQQQQQQQQHQPQQPSATYQQQQHSPVPQQHYGGAIIHGPPPSHHQSPRYAEHVLHSPTSGNSPASQLYYPHHQQQQQQQPGARSSPQLIDLKQQQQQQQQSHDHNNPNFMKAPMTPVPSASTSSGTSTPPQDPAAVAAVAAAGSGGQTGIEDDAKYARLSQLCSAALQQPTSTTPASTDQHHSQSDSSHPQQS